MEKAGTNANNKQDVSGRRAILSNAGAILGGCLLGTSGASASAQSPVKPTAIPRAFDVKEFGATGVRGDKATRPFKLAIEACSAAGGGTVNVPPGEYTVGTVRLRDHVTLNIDGGATLFLSQDKDDFTEGARALILAENARNISVTGRGVLDGVARYDFAEMRGVDPEISKEIEIARAAGIDMRRYYRSREAMNTFMFIINNCTDFLLTGVSIINSPLWTVRLNDCDRVSVRGVYIYSDLEKGVNADGIDICSSKNVTISDSVITTGDDAIVLKAIAREGREANPVENITVTNCILTSSSTPLMIGTETEADIRHVIFSNCVIRNSNKGFGINVQDGATVSDVIFSNLTIETGRRHWNWWGDAEMCKIVLKKRREASKLGSIRDIIIDNIRATAMGTATFTGHRDQALQNIRISNVDLFMVPENAKDKRSSHALKIDTVQGLKIRDLAVRWSEDRPEQSWKSALVLKNVTDFVIDSFSGRQGLKDGKSSAIILEDVNEGVIRESRAEEGTASFVHVQGKSSSEIQLRNIDTKRARQDVSFERRELSKSILHTFIIGLCMLLTTACMDRSTPQYRGLMEDMISSKTDSVLSDTIVYHPVRVDSRGHILPWYSNNVGESYDHVLGLVWNFWKTMEVDSNGMQYYMNHQVWDRDHDKRGLGGDQLNMALSSWDLYYNYTGDQSVIQNMKYIADYYLAHSMSSANAAWPHIPFPYNMNVESGIYDGDMIIGEGYTQPDKAGSFGIELVHLFKKTGDAKYLDAAVRIANTLASKVQPGDDDHSPWPFKVHAETGKVGVLIEKATWYEGMDKDLTKNKDQQKESAYTTFYPGTLSLFMELMAMKKGNIPKYEKAFDMTLTWLKNYPVKMNKWGPFFEDVPRWSDTQINAITYAMFIIEHPSLDAQWKETVNGIFDWVYRELGNDEWKKYGVTTINEQTAYRVPGNSHSARQASVELLFWEKSGDTTRVRNAVRALNWATYMVDTDGKNFYPTNAIWMTDGYGDYVRHYLRAMAAAPELAPPNEDHLLRTSSIVKNIEYKPESIRYSVFDNKSRERFRLTSKPSEVSVNGSMLAEVSGEDAEGWTWRSLPAGGILDINQSKGNDVEILHR